VPNPPPLAREVYPDFVTHLVGLLDAAGHRDLGICAWDVRIIALCACDDEFCQSFYTALPPQGAYGPGHRNIVLWPEHGMIILDVVDGRIMFVEIINHPPLHARRTAEPG
jgi:hypothetical protein